MRGEGRIFQPKKKALDGSVYVSPFWRIAYWGPKKGGKWGEVREATHTTDKRKAGIILRDRLRAVANHRSGVAAFQGPKQEKILVAHLFEALLTHYRNEKIKSLRNVEVHLKPIKEYFGHWRAVDVDADAVEHYIETRRTGKSPKANATINRETELLSAAFGLAVKKGRLSRKPYIPSLKEDNARRGFFEKEELAKILPHLPDPLDDMARFAFISGWRAGEVRELRWEWVDRRAREIRLPDSKNGDGRVLPLDEVDWQLIEKRWKMREYPLRGGGSGISEFVFHRKGKAIGEDTFGGQWRKARAKAKLQGKLFHDLRRTAARNMVRAGVPETVAMSITGHRTRAMFDRYNITSSEDKLEALRRRREYVEKLPVKETVANFSATRGKREQ